MIFGLFSIIVGFALAIFPPLAFAISLGLGLFFLSFLTYLTGEVCTRLDVVRDELRSIRKEGS